MTIPDFGSDLLGVVFRTAIVYLFLVLGFRFLGKREAGQLSTLDLVVLLVVANAVQNAMVGENITLIGGLVAAAVIFGLDRGLHSLTVRSPRVRLALEGKPVLLVRDGAIMDEALQREDISERELGIALRQNGLLTAAEARFVFLETNGQISVIPRHPGEDETEDAAFDADEPAAVVALDIEDPDAMIRAPRHRRRRPGRLSGTSI